MLSKPADNGVMGETRNSEHPAEPSLGAYLKEARRATGLTLRQVEEETSKAVTNGYLSQIENDDIIQPSPRILYSLATTYGIDYSDLLRRAGHTVPNETDDQYSDARALGAVNGFPLRSLQDLTETETEHLLAYIEFMKSRR